MRILILAPVVVAMLAGPAVAQQADPEFAAVAGLPCSAVANALGTPRYSELISPIVNHIEDNTSAAQRLGSSCNIGDYFRVECKMHPTRTVSKIVKTLVDAAIAGQRLPRIPRCGA